MGESGGIVDPSPSRTPHKVHLLDLVLDDLSQMDGGRPFAELTLHTRMAQSGQKGLEVR